jgi:hypothetical protein
MPLIRFLIAIFLPALLTAAPVDFATEILPIFAKKCTNCHGGVKQKGGLSLLSRTAALKETKEGNFAIVPGDSATSSVLHRLRTDDLDERMPPEGDPLSAAEIDALSRWIEEGAEWPSHWAFAPPPATVEVPEVAGDWPRNAIDHFVLRALSASHISPSPEADRIMLIRRLSLDITGLSPTPEEVDAFVDDTSPHAYEALVDRLLASSHYGERWGRHWLDRARYADSDGYEKDNARPNAWRWRDWVINAFNADIPFDQFTREQLAGDLIPDATPTQKLATAFHRQTLYNREGGVDPEEDRTKRLIDRVNTTAGVWLGLTIGCTQCHDHPYDPLSQKGFYEFMDFFNSADEAHVDLPRGSSMNAALTKAREGIDSRFDAWLADAESASRADAGAPLAYHPLSVKSARAAPEEAVEVGADGTIFLPGKAPAASTYRIEAAVDLAQAITGFRLEVLADKRLPKRGPGRTAHGNFVLNSFELEGVRFAQAEADFSQKKWHVSGAIDEDKKSGWAISPQMGKNHQATFWAASPLGPGPETLTFRLLQGYGGQHLIGKFRLSAITGTPPKDALSKELRAILVKASDARSAADSKALLAHYEKQVDPNTAPIHARLAELARAGSTKVRVLSQRRSPRATYIFHRGDFLQPKKDLGAVRSKAPECLPPITARDSKKGIDRLDLAEWMMEADNPLTARVAVNDIWAQLFGRPLATPKDDWGTRAERPSHPQLLDWLAREFQRLGWSRKALIKTIVRSASYRQSSTHRPEMREIDPDNHLLHRQNRLRIEGELIRDNYLAAAGLFSPKVGGPSVFPPLPADVAKQSYANNFKWKTSPGENRYRRGMYTFFKRTAPHPNLMTFDCPDANVSVSARGRSNTPLQALATLQNPVFHEAAQALAGRALSLAGDDAQRLVHTFRLCTARAPSAAELARLEELLATNRAAFAEESDSAAKLASAHRPKDIPVSEAAAWVATTRIILNLDEVITRP